ncbi:AAA family ATPase [Spirillospora sp. CA-142024]|uniref:AAA family ATPase n=1 Tax=Spirillospora sp. CA-142024 TaxID=3240036 RepID=UPI003D8F7448
MRPISLTLSGLRSYPGTMPTLDFTGKSRVGIVGDTGAGKSTLLEAITLALYGTATWDQSEIKGLIADGVDVMTVDLTFRCHDQTWRVRRRYHRGRTGSTHLLENLDTGEKVDDRRPVDKRIVDLLRLTFKEFQATVLLPQGRFDQLLHATGTQRTELLEGIFGTRELDTVRARADHHRQTITELLTQAEVQRAGLLSDPAAASREQYELAQAATSRAAQVHAIHEQMAEVQRQAQILHAADTRLGEALDSLVAAQADIDLSGLPAITQAETEVADAEAQCGRDEAAAQSSISGAAERLAAAAERGVTTESLSVADTYLTDLSQRLQTLKDDQDHIATERERLDTEASDLEAAIIQHGVQTEHIARLAEHSLSTKDLAETTATAADGVKGDVREAISMARRVSVANAACMKAKEKADRLRSSLPDLKDQTADLQLSSRRAAETLGALQRADAAHTAADGLSAGDLCTVCAQTLPNDYKRLRSTAPEEIASAQNTARRTLGEFTAANAALATARANLASADQEAATTRHEAATEKQLLVDMLAMVLSNHPIALVSAGEPSPVDLDAFRTALTQATTEICLQKPPSRRSATERRRDAALTDELCRPFSVLAEQRAAHADRAREEQHQAETDAKATAARIQDRADSLERDERALAGKVRACDATERLLTRLLAELPPDVRIQMPSNVDQITDGDIRVAAEVVKELSSEHQKDTAASAEATAALTAAVGRRTRLTQRRDTDVIGPLRRILETLVGCTSTQRTCQAILGGPDLPEPVSPDHLSSTTVSAYAEAVTTSGQRIATALRQRRALAEDDLTRYGTTLDGLLVRARDALGGHEHELPETLSPLNPADLTSVAACTGMLRQQARDHEQRAQAAAVQIDTARQLDGAITAGTRRQATLNDVHRLLSDGKFVRYLIDRRTHALLRVGNHLFHQLTRGELGFTDDFRIMNRLTGATRATKTLSGGESFLASLGLALALIELHSRNGARLDSLFLDEGFGALDTTTLDVALNVLRDQSGGDKLVTVISHLHTVAEAVDDVLLVERSPAGSKATWLTAEQRDAFIFGQASSGLLATAGHGPHEEPH